jgi:hypothetical protein
MQEGLKESLPCMASHFELKETVFSYFRLAATISPPGHHADGDSDVAIFMKNLPSLQSPLESMVLQVPSSQLAAKRVSPY